MDLNDVELEIMSLDMEQDAADQALKAAQAKRDKYASMLAEISAELEAAKQEVMVTNAKKLGMRSKRDSLMESKQDMQRQAERSAYDRERQLESLTMTARWEKLCDAYKWHTSIKDYQRKVGELFCMSGHILVGDGIGLGKTLEAISAIDYLKAATEDASQDNVIKVGTYNCRKQKGRKVLVLGSNAIIDNLVQEFSYWAPHRTSVSIAGMPKIQRAQTLKVLATVAQDYVIFCNLEAWRKDLALTSQLIEMEFDSVIIDEAHDIKDMASIAHRGVRTIIDGVSPVGIILMTGTPILNRPEELFSLLNILRPYEYSSLPAYKKQFCELKRDADNQTIVGKYQFRAGGLESLIQRMSSFFIRRTKAEVGINLPPQGIMEVCLEIDKDKYPNQAAAREMMRDQALLQLEEGNVSAAAVIAMITRLRQIETWPAGMKFKVYGEDRDPDTGKPVVIRTIDLADNPAFQESQKIDYILRPNGSESDPSWDDPAGLLIDIDRERAVVFSQFSTTLHELKRRCDLAGLRAVVLDGSTKEDIRREVKFDFDRKHTTNGQHRWDVVLCNYKVGGVGLNFTCATQTVVLDEEWNGGKRDQAYGRTHRVGQTEETTVTIIRVKDSIDTWLQALISEKDEMTNAFVDVHQALIKLLGKK